MVLQLFPLLSWGQAPIEYDFPPENISINGPVDITNKRQSMIDFIWGTNGWPSKRVPDQVTTDLVNPFYDQIKTTEGNLSRIDRYTFNMDHDFVAVVDHFIPANSNGKLFIYHAGHGYGYQWEDYSPNGGYVGAGLVIPNLLKLGYSVLGISMPLQGQPRPMTPPAEGELEWMQYTSLGHIQMFRYLDNPYTYYFDPIMIALNYVEDTYGYSDIYMTGLSGGGWTTTVYAALDERIRFSFPVAGTMPLYLRKGKEGYGDAEQGDDYTGLLGIANYEEMYVMSSYGKKRGQYQITNTFDNCCFYDNVRNLQWVDTVKLKMEKLELGRYNFFTDDSSYNHRVTKRSYNEIMKFINYYEKNDSSSLLISEQRTDTLMVGDSTSFNIEVLAENVLYNWQVNVNDGKGFVPITDTRGYRGLGMPVLYIDSVTYGMNNYSYRCMVSGDSIPTTTGYALHLKVLRPLALLAQPTSVAACSSDHLSFTVAAEGDSLRYQWQLDDGTGFKDILPGATWSGVTGPTLDIWNTDGLEGKKFRNRVSTIFGEEVISDSAGFEFKPEVSITRQPSDYVISAGSATYSVRAKGGVESLRWQVDDGNGFVDIVDDDNYVGTTSENLTVLNPTIAFDQYKFRCVIKGPCDTLTSVPASLRVIPVVSITVRVEEPELRGQDPTADSKVFLKAGAEGEGLTYLWQANNGDGFHDLHEDDGYSGVNASELTIQNIQDVQDGYTFRCVVSGARGAVIVSEKFIVPPFKVVQQPESANTCVDATASFTLHTASAAAKYQWQVNRGDGHGFADIQDAALFEGFRTNTLSVRKTTASMNGYEFQCLATSSVGKRILSSQVKLGVTELPGVMFTGPENLISQCHEPVELLTEFTDGVFSGEGVSGTTFDPSQAALGRQDITFTRTKDGCSSSVIVSTLVYACDQESKYFYNIATSPNPSNGIVDLSFETVRSLNVSVSVYSGNGKLVDYQQYKTEPGVQSYRIDLTSESKGLYLVMVQAEGETNIRRIVIN